ncbi:mechanosensitive ion channel family protein [Paracrocinitomix mangrovi]|uniref:mechanosensitive ion channel family protein n=1 Tax=Paracrocinitomix mangrovi TaxID=2862509 RepID=UPI001C8E0716|nr:mechanosensitive ion channel family protein [Paracrocinitomix mangrovi]UKN02607.1 mechanosensitive ion channel family protein [Paracrocinitomix mangrovi]
MNTDLLNRTINANQIGTISVQTVVFLLIIGAVLYAFFFLARKYVVPYLGSRKAVKKMTVILYRAEVAAWVIYVVFGLYQLFSDSLYITGAIVVLSITAGWNIWRDVLTGIAFRLEDKFKINDPVRFENYNGTLSEINSRNIRIKSDKEELITIPFRKLNNEIFIKRQAKGKLHSEQLNLNVGNRTAEEITPLLQRWLYECPWAVMNEKAKIKVIGGGLVQLTVYAVDRASIIKTEEFLQQRLR